MSSMNYIHSRAVFQLGELTANRNCKKYTTPALNLVQIKLCHDLQNIFYPSIIKFNGKKGRITADASITQLSLIIYMLDG